MALTGDLGSIDLANVFQMLQLSQKTGTLEIRSRGARTEVYLDGESILYPFDRDSFPAKVLRLLLRAGRISDDALAKARQSTTVLKRDLLSVLIGMHAVTDDVVASAYREQMEEEVYELFADRDATFEFRENEEPRGHGKVIDARYRLSGAGLLMEAARRLDEWGYIREKVSSDLCVFEVAGKIEQVPEEERDGALVDVFANLDGIRLVRALVEKTGLTRFTVCKRLAQLANQRIIYEVPLEVITERARTCLREQRAGEGLALLERAFELGASEPRVHEMAALAYQALNRVGDACRHHSMVAQALERAGDRRGAAEVHLRVRDLMPTDVRSRERLVRHRLDEPDFFASTKYDAEKESVELVQILRELGREQDACKLLVEVQQHFPDDARLTWKLADLAVDAGEPKSAVAMLMSCADEMLAQRQHSTALRLYRRVRSIDPQREGLDLRIDSCERAARPVRVVRGGTVRLAVAAVVLIGAAFAFFTHNSEAFAKLAEIDTEELVLAGDFPTAIGTLDAFRSEHPVTAAALVAQERIRDLEARRAAYESDQARRTELLKTEAERRQRSAERHYADAMQRLGVKELTGALDGFRQAVELASDARWLEVNKPGQKAAEIEGYLHEAQTTFQEFETARAKTEWAKAHDLAVRLLREHPDAPEARKLQVPVKVTADPPDAQIEIDGVPGPFKSPAIVMLPAGRVANVRCRREGSAMQEVKVAPDATFEVAIHLDRAPDQVVELKAAPIFPPAIQEQRAFFACTNGRLVAVDLATLTEVWGRPLPELEDFAGPVEVDEQGLRVATRSEKLIWFQPANGDEIARQRDVGAPPRTSLTLSVTQGGGATLDGEPDGRIELKDASGAVQATWRCPGPLKWGIALPGGGALFGGGKLLVRVVPPEFTGK
jgi:tetratricopeptide (TPR) repeat protein